MSRRVRSLPRRARYGLLAFVSDREGTDAVFVMRPDGSEVRRLTGDLPPTSHPSWSPDGQRIAFNAGTPSVSDIYVINSDGSGLTKLTNQSAGNFYPSWSPDGSRLAFSSNRDGDWDIYVMQDDGSQVRQLVDAPGLDDKPRWTPDGSRVGFATTRHGYPELFAVDPTTRVPIGPVGVITPWNTPFMLSTWKIAPALAAGCTIVHKPAELSPLTARLLVEIAEEAGLPKGVWNLVNGFGEDAGKALTEHPDIKAIGFVGESRTGSMIMKQGADTLKRVHFELGGKNPVIVFADADLERAADAAVFMIYSLNGERCTSSSRLLVEDSVYDKFTALVAEKAKRIKIGHPLDPETVIGPLIHPVHEEKVLSYIEIGKSEGAIVAAGGDQVRRPGRRLLCQPDAVHRRQQHNAHRPGGDLRAGADRDPVQGRGRGAGARQRHAIRPDRLSLDRGRHPRLPLHR